MNLKERIKESLQALENRATFRRLIYQPQLIDFCSNDYLGLARAVDLKEKVAERYASEPQSGATGSRLISGHHRLMEELEAQLCSFHSAESALLFNSGYDANLGLFSALPRRGDVIFYDALVHASIHDGMRMGKAESIAFVHNDPADLERLLTLHQPRSGATFVAIESVYSMDGDIAPLVEIVNICNRFDANLIVDEAHATGVIGSKGEGLVAFWGLQNHVFARVHTFGKAIGGHGAAVLGAALLRDYLINYARPLIFSTALPLHSVIHASEAYKLLSINGNQWISDLQGKVKNFIALLESVKFPHGYISSDTPIQGIFVQGNASVSAMAKKIQSAGFDVRPIRYPTVPAGRERLRICLHLFNTQTEMQALLKSLL